MESGITSSYKRLDFKRFGWSSENAYVFTRNHDGAGGTFSNGDPPDTRLMGRFGDPFGSKPCCGHNHAKGRMQDDGAWANLWCTA